MRLALAAAIMSIGATTFAAMQGTDGYFIGYTELRTDLTGGRAANIMTSRAFVVRADGKCRREVAPQLIASTNTWTQFAGWSPDGRQAIIYCGWESSENAVWEEEHKSFRMNPGDWLLDCYLVDMSTGKATNLTAIERVSHYNSGLFFWPNHPNRLGFTPLIGGQSRPFSMNLDGSDKKDLSQRAGFTYGFNASPDGRRIAYHQGYRVYLADADGGNALEIKTGFPFNFAPKWSPDGEWVAFVAGVRENCHPYVVRRNGTDMRKVADRGGYHGWILFLDVPDYHEGSSDLPSWSADSLFLYYTAKVGEAVELLRVSLDGAAERLSHSRPGVLHYHPTASPDGKQLLFGSTRDDVRQLYVANADGSEACPITIMSKGSAAMWAYWQP